MGDYSRLAQRRPQEDAAPNILRPPLIGVVAFNHRATPTSGVACVAGRSLKSFQTRAELPSDVIWLSDADQATLSQNFRDSAYLRTKIWSLALDIGVNPGDMVEGLPALANMVGRVRDIAIHAYQWAHKPDAWSEASLSKWIESVLPMPEKVGPDVEAELLNAYQPYSFVPDLQHNNLGGQGMVTIAMRVNRLRYAMYLCSQLFPIGEWTSLKESPTLDQLLDPTRPCLAEVSVECFPSEVIPPNLVAYGSATSRRSDQIRRWVSQPELAWLIEHANVHVGSVLVADGAQPLAQSYQLPKLLTSDPAFALSVAAGVVAENHWAALSSVRRVRRLRPGATATFVRQVSAMAVWLRALDRAYSFQMAAAVAKRGYIVRSYGYGSVIVSVPRLALHGSEILELADEIGACHPCLEVLQDMQRLNTEDVE